MNLLDEAAAILQTAGYSTEVSLKEGERVYFEDNSLFGILRVCENVELLLSAWENEQESFLRSNANRLRSSPSKAWNAYSIFLTRSECPADKQSALLNVEEDFHGTRKIARAGIAAKTDIFRALFPLLPIQHAATLKAETAVQALRERLPLRPEEKSAVVNGLSAQDILLAFLAEEEDL